MKGIEGKELTSTRGLNPKERAAGEVFDASSGFIQLEELTLQLSESDSDTDIKQIAEGMYWYTIKIKFSNLKF